MTEHSTVTEVSADVIGVVFNTARDKIQT